MQDVPLVEVLRDDQLESLHRGSVAVADASGRLRAWAGDPGTVTFWRSSMKPIQVLPAVDAGAFQEPLGDIHLATACASHNGERLHTDAVDAMLAAGGIPPERLACGTHPPFTDPRNAKAYEAMLARGERPDVRHNNCSGKHAAMLLACLRNDWPLDGYLDPGHPLQRRIRSLITLMTGEAESRLRPAVDGCSAPIYALPLSAMATAYARLAAPPAGLEASCARVVRAMTTHPLQVHGHGGFDSELMLATAGRILSKRGAEGIACLTVPALGLGIAIKASDGTGRATPPAILEVLTQLGAITEAELGALAEHARPPVRNVVKRVVGEIRPAAFRLSRA